MPALNPDNVTFIKYILLYTVSYQIVLLLSNIYSYQMLAALLWCHLSG